MANAIEYAKADKEFKSGVFFLLFCIGIDVILFAAGYKLDTTSQVISYGITGLAALHACGLYGKREKLREAGSHAAPDLEMGASKGASKQHPAAARAGQAAPVAAPVVAVAAPVVAVAAPAI